ncbi:hypothetical protein ACFLSS_00640 [Bacteroidota bacterium]
MKLIKGSNIILLTILLVITAGVLLYNYVFSIYEVIVVSEPEIIFADPTNVVKIYLEPINAMGQKVPLRKVDCHFSIIEGNHLITIESVDEKNGEIQLRSLGIPGKIGLTIKSQYSLFPIYYEVQILNKSA